MYYLSINKEFSLMVTKEFRELMLEFSLCSRRSSDWGLQVFLSVHGGFHTASDIGTCKGTHFLIYLLLLFL